MLEHTTAVVEQLVALAKVSVLLLFLVLFLLAVFGAPQKNVQVDSFEARSALWIRRLLGEH